jgi:hypothetical protein
MVRKLWPGSIGGGLVLLLTVGGCGILETDTGRPDRARLILDEASTTSLEVSTSLNFVVTEGNTINFEDLTVDTVAVPFDQTYEIGQYARFYVLVTNVEDETISFHMKVTIDGKSWYNEQKTLESGKTAQFVYRYREPILF